MIDKTALDRPRFPQYTERQFLAAMARATRLNLTDDDGYERFMDEVVNRCSESQWRRAEPFLAPVARLAEVKEVTR